MRNQFLSKLNKQLIQPRSTPADEQRREYIFNVLIAFFTLAAIVTTVSSGLTHLFAANAHKANSVPGTTSFLIVTGGLWWTSRKGHYKLGAYTLVFLVWLASLQLSLAWSIELPMAQLLNILVIVLAGITVSSRMALAVTCLTSLSTIVIGYLQTTGRLAADVSWLTKPLEFSDAIGLVAIYSIVGAISWLANNEIDNLLRRAWKSEAALAKQRDQLEITVAKRTKELERTQLKRELELQQFAEFGRVSASLLHDLTSPVTAASLNLEQAQDGIRTDLVLQARASLRHIERYITTARKQLQGDGEVHSFNASQEIREVIELLRNQASVAGVSLNLSSADTAPIYGSPVAFHRIMANLLINAIQSYEPKTTSKTKTVDVAVYVNDHQAIITIQDYGVGIASTDLPHIFKDFYSTKKHIGRGLGLGLANAKQVIEDDFGGSITVSSSRKIGTIFTITIPNHEQPTKKQHTRRT